MSNNAELVRRGHAAYSAAFKTGDPSRLLSLLDPKVEWLSGAGAMEGEFHGRDGVRRWLNDFWESWEELELETEEVVEGAHGRVFAAARIRGRGKSSRATVEMRMYEIVEIRDDLIARRADFATRESAMAAAGDG